jgi:glycine cleavage system H protein
MQTLRSQKTGGFTAMKEHFYITETGERVRERDGLVQVGLSPKAQVALGTLLHFQPPKIGQLAREGEHLFVVEGTRTAAEFYAPVSGTVVRHAATNASISDWMVVVKRDTTQAC